MREVMRKIADRIIGAVYGRCTITTYTSNGYITKEYVDGELVEHYGITNSYGD